MVGDKQVPVTAGVAITAVGSGDNDERGNTYVLKERGGSNFGKNALPG